jgi:hypothetical protein
MKMLIKTQNGAVLLNTAHISCILVEDSAVAAVHTGSSEGKAMIVATDLPDPAALLDAITQAWAAGETIFDVAAHLAAPQAEPEAKPQRWEVLHTMDEVPDAEGAVLFHHYITAVKIGWRKHASWWFESRPRVPITTDEYEDLRWSYMPRFDTSGALVKE